MHRRLGEIAPNPEERARHLALSAERPDENVAVALDQAAQAAAARGAPAAAAELAELASALNPLDRSPARWSRRADAGGYLFRAGDTARARSHLEALVEEMPAGPDRAEALLVLAEVLSYDVGEAAAIPLLERALAEASASQMLQARIHIEIAKPGAKSLDDTHYVMVHQPGATIDHQAKTRKLQNITTIMTLQTAAEDPGYGAAMAAQLGTAGAPTGTDSALLRDYLWG